MLCINCLENIVPPKRRKLGYKTCLACGEKAARKESNRRKGQISIPYNKGPYMYIGSIDQVKDIGKK
jgi:hypothetical protein